MGPESFEDSIKKKFEGQAVSAPDGIWNSLESVLNDDLTSKYATQKNQYKWLSVAAVLIALLSIGAQLFSFSSNNESPADYSSYNALLSNDFEANLFQKSFSGSLTPDFSFGKIEKDKETEVNEVRIEPMTVNSDDIEISLPSRFLAFIKPDLATAAVETEIYRYYVPGTALSGNKKGKDSETKVWAGVEAGAGSFNSDFGGTGTLTNSLNPAGLASALGSGNFVNPSTSISQNMEEGIATSIGLDFGVQLGKRWTLESGLSYTSMDNSGLAAINVVDVYTIENTDFLNGPDGPDGVDNGFIQIGTSSREAVIDVEENYDYEVELNNSVRLASLPLKAGYFVMNRKFKLRLNAGLAANYLIEGNLSDPSKEILNSNDLNLYNDWSFDGIGGLEFGYSIFEKFDFTLEPNYRHAITSISNSTDSPSRFVIQTGLRYTLK
ncbi:hypothetical protein [Ekhidna sp.]